MYAIIRDRGKQYKVTEGQLLDVDFMSAAKKAEAIEFSEVLLTSDGNGTVNVGEPLVAGKVSAQVVEPKVKGDKIDVVHFRRRKDSMSKVGHRQPYTRIKIEKIEVGS
jgi:large subunit ribosomal protein L21